MVLAPRECSSTQRVVDNDATAYEPTAYLLGLGHRDIKFVGGLPGLVAAEMRVRGYQRTMYDVECLPVAVGQSEMSQQTGLDATRGILASARCPTALIYTNDEIVLAPARRPLAGRRAGAQRNLRRRDRWNGHRTRVRSHHHGAAAGAARRPGRRLHHGGGSDVPPVPAYRLRAGGITAAPPAAVR